VLIILYYFILHKNELFIFDCTMSTSTQWRGPFTKTIICKGSKGIVIEGVVKETRVHSVFISGDTSSPAEQGL